MCEGLWALILEIQRLKNRFMGLLIQMKRTKMRKTIYVIIILLIAISLAAIGIRRHKTNKILSLIVLVPEQASPLDTLSFQTLSIPLSDRTLSANFLSAGDKAKAFFICTGNGEALYEWKPLQAYLLEKGYSSFIFSYSGFGNSTGKPTERAINEDLKVAYQEFINITPLVEERIALSHSLGGAPLLQMANELKPAPSKLLVHGAFSSTRDLLIDMGMASRSFIWLWPDIWNSKENVENIDIPLYFVHSKNDQTISYTHSQKLEKAAENNSQLLLMDDYGHNAIYKNTNDSLWISIFEFISK